MRHELPLSDDERSPERSDSKTLERRALLKGIAASIPTVGLLSLGACGGGGPGPADADLELDADFESDADVDGALCEPTRNDALGPFYVEGAPERTQIADASEPGDRVLISGRVLGADCTTPIGAALIEIWHADASGSYHESSEDWRLRARFNAGADGSYQFETIRPGHYSGRPQHYHYRVTSPGTEALVTQLYFVGDPFLGPNDSCGEGACDSSDPERIIALVEQDIEGEPFLVGEFDISLQAS